MVTAGQKTIPLSRFVVFYVFIDRESGRFSPRSSAGRAALRIVFFHTLAGNTAFLRLIKKEEKEDCSDDDASSGDG